MKFKLFDVVRVLNNEFIGDLTGYIVGNETNWSFDKDFSDGKKNILYRVQFNKLNVLSYIDTFEEDSLEKVKYGTYQS